MTSCGALSTPYVALDADGQAPGVPVQLVLEGNDSVSSARLHRLLEDRMYDLSRAPGSEAVVQDIRFDVEDFFRNEGFRDVRVDAELEAATEQEEPGVRELRIRITENSQITVRTMDVTGAGELDRDELLAFWLQRGSGTFGLGAPLYVENDVLGFAQSLRLFLIGNGYLDCAARVASTIPVSDGRQVDVTVAVEEGPLYRVGVVSTAAKLVEALGDADVHLNSGDPAAARALDDFRNRAREELRRRGRPEPDIRLELTKDSGSRTVDVHLMGTPGRRAVISMIDIRGLERTEESAVRELLEFAEGEVYDGSKVDASLRELYLTGLFRRVDLQHEWIDGAAAETKDGRMLMRISIEELETRSVEALVGYGSYERMRAKVRFEENNLFGTGRAFAVEGRVSQRGWRGLTSVTDRNFLGTRTQFSVSADAMRREEPSFIDNSVGGTAAFSRNILERWTARLGYTYRTHSDLQNDAITPAASITDYIQASPFFETRLDTRDSPIYPRDGLQLSARFDANNPAFGSDLDFVRARISAAYYVAFSDKLSLALRSDQGWLWPNEGSDLIPLQERFYNGGENTVRSFRQAQLGPKDFAGNPLGGEFRNVFGVELRGQLFRTLEGALFTDAGNVGSRVQDYGLDDLSYGLGAGLRLALPIGPVRFDTGWNPAPKAGERTWTLHLSVGYPF